MKIGIVGMGFVGSATAEVMSSYHEVVSYDKFKEEYNNPTKLSDLETIFLCVPTPIDQEGNFDDSNMRDALETLVSLKFKSKPLIVLRSTAVPGTSDELELEYPFHFASNPEFLREKHAGEDMKNINRIIIGAEQEQYHRKIKQIYHPAFPNATYIHVNRKTAEMMKYASNVMLASQVAIANEIYQICNSLGVDYEGVKNILLMDSRIGKWIEVPGPDGKLGFGGKCFPKDMNALIRLAEEKGYTPKLLKEIIAFNEKIREEKDWLNIVGATSENNYSS